MAMDERPLATGSGAVAAVRGESRVRRGAATDYPDAADADGFELSGREGAQVDTVVGEPRLAGHPLVVERVDDLGSDRVAVDGDRRPEVRAVPFRILVEEFPAAGDTV